MARPVYDVVCRNMTRRPECGDTERELDDERHREDLLFGPLVLWSAVCVVEVDLARAGIIGTSLRLT